MAVAESCTGGLLATRIVDTPGSGEWFKGGLVAYDAAVKFRLLNVPEGPVITDQAAMAMARGARDLLEAGIGVAVTGVAGPDPEEGIPVGTVFLGISDEEGERAVELQLRGSPREIREAAAARALTEILTRREEASSRGAAKSPS